VRPEAPVGPFSLDLLARVVGTQDRAVIENQLERTDHDHLGKLLTYTAGYDATHVIWISSEFREEHRAALDWLNNNTSPDRNFFGILVEALQIDDSRPAVNFRIVVSPNAWQKAASQTAQEINTASDQEQLNQVFNAIYDLAKASGPFVRLLKPLGTRSYYVLERTHRQVEYAVAFSRDSIRAELWLNFPDPGMNVHLFRSLKLRAEAIERALAGGVDWDFNESRRRQGLRVAREIDRGRLAEQIADVARWAAQKIIAFRQIVEVGLDNEVKAALTEAALRDDNAIE
jgi:hypothetical protein